MSTQSEQSVDTMCLDCGDSFKNVSTHWSLSDCDRPQFTDDQMEILTGCLMSDGCLSRTNQNPYIEVRMAEDSLEYLKWIDEELGILSNGVKLRATSDEKFQRAKDADFIDSDKYDFQDFYGVSTVSHPQLQKFTSWYESGEKVWGSDIEMTPKVLRHLYVGDGHYCSKNGQRRIRLGVSNEIENESKVAQMFNRVDLPAPSSWKGHEAAWTVEQSRELFEFMGDPLPSFEYKWPSDHGGTGRVIEVM